MICAVRYAVDLPASRFAFHVSGDLPSSNRLFDIVKAGAVPVVSAKQIEAALPFADAVRWDQMMIRLGDEKLTAEGMRAVVSKPSTDPEIQALRKQLQHHVRRL